MSDSYNYNSLYYNVPPPGNIPPPETVSAPSNVPAPFLPNPHSMPYPNQSNVPFILPSQTDMNFPLTFPPPIVDMSLPPPTPAPTNYPPNDWNNGYFHDLPPPVPTQQLPLPIDITQPPPLRSSTVVTTYIRSERRVDNYTMQSSSSTTYLSSSYVSSERRDHDEKRNRLTSREDRSYRGSSESGRSCRSDSVYSRSSKDSRYKRYNDSRSRHYNPQHSRSSNRDTYSRSRDSDRCSTRRERSRSRGYRERSQYSKSKSISSQCEESSRKLDFSRSKAIEEKSALQEDGSRSSSVRHSKSWSRSIIDKKSANEEETRSPNSRDEYSNNIDKVYEILENLADVESDEDERWYRSSPAELYYEQQGDKRNVMQSTSRGKKLSETFKEKLIERGRNARPEPGSESIQAPRCHKPTLRKHINFGNNCQSSGSESATSESDSDEVDHAIQELKRKQQHPRRLHPEMWYNDPGEMNDGPLCRCSARTRRQGIRHGIYAGETRPPPCDPSTNNADRLYHYRITISPPTNFLIKTLTVIKHDEHEFLFSGFSLLCHYPLEKLPPCKVIRFNIEYAILYVEEQAPLNYTIDELELFEEFLFREILELVDLDMGKRDVDGCSQFHLLPRWEREVGGGGGEVLAMAQVLRYLLKAGGPLTPEAALPALRSASEREWQAFVDGVRGMIVTYPGKKPCSVRVDQLDRTLSEEEKKAKEPDDAHQDGENSDLVYPEIVHFGIRPPQLSYAGNPEYKKAWRDYVKFRHLVANMAKPSYEDKRKLEAKEAKLQEMRTQTKMKRDVTVAVSSNGFYRTGLMCDVVQHAMLIPVLISHLRFHKSLQNLEDSLDYKFQNRGLLQLALTHPSYRENFGTNPDHARNSLTNCGIRHPEYGDRRIHYMNIRKRGINTLINIMSRFGKKQETESAINHNERLEFLGDAVVEFLSSIHLFRMFPSLEEGGLATYRAAIVQNQHFAQLAKKLGLEKYMLYAHGSDLCHDLELGHAMANCFEALMGALFLDGGIDVADRVFALALWRDETEHLETWNKPRLHLLQEQEPLGDRRWIPQYPFLQKLTKFEDSIGIEYKHIRLLARAFTDRSMGFTNLTLGSNQRLEFLGDTVLQLISSEYLYKHFPEHHEGHLSLLRSSLVNNRTQAVVCDDLAMTSYAVYHNPKAEPKTKDKADLLEAFLGSLYIEKGLQACLTFCSVCLFPRLREFIMNQEWNDPKSKLQQCCLTLRAMDGNEPDIPIYKVIECVGPTNTRVYTVAVYFRGERLASAKGHYIQEAEMNAAKAAIANSNNLFPQLDHQKRVIAKSMKNQKRRNKTTNMSKEKDHKRRSTDGKDRKHSREDSTDRNISNPEERIRNRIINKLPKAYRLSKVSDDSDSSSNNSSEPENKSNTEGNLTSDDEQSKKPKRKKPKRSLGELSSMSDNSIVSTKEYRKQSEESS